ncbi:winged helix-turn-helix domain-containing protein, partial [Streptomyces olivaceus]|uniref:winged helix-turn-helix domain-containing protein n=1 Tax=Streptomyces olivaceus TaxID=47716 RepID=UPI0033BB7BC5
ARAPAVGGPPSAGGLAVDPAARRATKDGTELALTLREFDLLAFFLRHPGRAFARDELMREVWGWDFGDLSTVTVHVRRLRGKVEDDPARPALVQTVWGVGYRFDPAGREERDGSAVRGEREERDGSAVRGEREERDGPAVRGGREGHGGSAVRGGRETG